MRYLSKCLFLIVCFIPMLSAAAVKVDKAAPQFSLQNSQGETVNLADFKDKYVILEWTNHLCPYVKNYSANIPIKTLFGCQLSLRHKVSKVMSVLMKLMP